jgi:hypothetical protein
MLSRTNEDAVKGTTSSWFDKKDTTRLDDNDIMTRSKEWAKTPEHYE